MLPCCNNAPPWSGEGLDLCGDQYEEYDQSGECEEVHLEGRACRHVATMRPLVWGGSRPAGQSGRWP